MGWGDWRVPEIPEETEFSLRVQEMELLQSIERDPQAVIRQLQQMTREKAALERVVEKATRRITELEVAAALGPTARKRHRMGFVEVYWGLAICFVSLCLLGGAHPVNLVVLVALLVFLRPQRRG